MGEIRINNDLGGFVDFSFHSKGQEDYVGDISCSFEFVQLCCTPVRNLYKYDLGEFMDFSFHSKGREDLFISDNYKGKNDKLYYG